MVDESNTDREYTPVQPGAAPMRADNTVKLDRAIVLRDPSYPARFGRYQVSARIGVGGFATVYSAIDPELDAPVAIKVLAENHSADVEIRRRFVAEARVARRLGSARLIGVFDLGETEDGRPYVVMELADRGTLRARIGSGPRTDRATLVRLVEELAECLAAIHDKGIVHRDIKPTNLLVRSVNNRATADPGELLSRDEHLVLGDFGLARDISLGASGLTVGGGTAGYMAPEQADPRGKPDQRADIYAASVVLAEVATGRHPERLDLDTAPLPGPFGDALRRCLALDREERPLSAGQWRDELLAALNGEQRTEQFGGSPSPASTTARTASEAATETGAEARTEAETQTAAAEAGTQRHDTRIQAPFPYNRDLFDDDSFGSTLDARGGRDRPTLVPAEALDVRTYVERPADETPPPPPPSLPQKRPASPPPPTSSTPPPPAPTIRQPTTEGPSLEPEAALPPAAQAPTDRGVATQPATAPATQAASQPATVPAPAIRPPIAPPPASPTVFAGPAPIVRADPSRPAPPVAASGPAPAAPTFTPPAPAPIFAGPAPIVRPGSGVPTPAAPPVVSHPTSPQPQVPPPPTPTAPPPAPESRAPEPVPARGGGNSNEAEAQSKRHMKTAQRLAKLEQREQRKVARWRRRRRRFVTIVNFFLAIIRGTISAVLGALVTAAYLSRRLGTTDFASYPRAQVLLLGVAVTSFFLGLIIFPFPRGLQK